MRLIVALTSGGDGGERCHYRSLQIATMAGTKPSLVILGQASALIRGTIP